MAEVPSRLVGQPVRRVEDRRLLTGRGTFVEDVVPRDVVHLAILRSQHAHGLLRGVDGAAALATPGVLAILTGQDTRTLNPFPVRDRTYEPVIPYEPVLAVDRVRYVGEPIAAVVAVSPAVAYDALERIDVEIEPLEAVVDKEAALRPDAPLLHDDVPGNVCVRWARTSGDVDGAFARSTHVVRVRMPTNRVAPAPIEPRGVTAVYDQGHDLLTVYASSQTPHPLRRSLAAMLGVPEARVRVVAQDIGGGFGCKSGIKREDVLVPFAARLLRRSVKWTATRREDLLVTSQGRGVLHEAEAAADADGRVTALRVRTIHTPGAYVAPNGFIPLFRSSEFTCGPYRIPAVAREILGVLTNTTHTGPHRGTGRPESILLIERVIEKVAGVVGLDPLEARRRNLVRDDEFPYRTATDLTFDSGAYHQTVQRLAHLAGYEALRERQREARARGELLGIGLSTCMGMTATGMWQSATVRVEASGHVTVMTGSTPQGQGHETVWAQVAADALGVPMREVTVQYGDTSATPYGLGTTGTTGAPLAAPAVQEASHRVKEKILAIAAQRLETQPRDLEIQQGRIGVVGVPGRSIALREVAQWAYTGHGLPHGMDTGLEASATFRQASEPFAFGAFLAVTRVDAETGAVTVERVVGVDDCGVVLNPLLLEGQMHGGVAWGLGQVLFEQVVYDESGQPLMTSFLDYALARASNIPALDLGRVVTPSPLNPFGAKGGGEGANIAVPAAVYNAVLDALAPLGVHEVPLPLVSQNVWMAMAGARLPFAP